MELTPKRGADLLRSATKKIQTARALAGAAMPKEKPRIKVEVETERYLGPLVSLLEDVCRCSGFAYGEVWIRPFRTHRDADGTNLAQWEYHMHHSGYYFVNKDTFKEAVPGKTVQEDFMTIIKDITYSKGVGVVGYAWQRGQPDWQDLSAVTTINEFLQSDRWITSDTFQKYFDQSVAVPVRHPTWNKVMGVLVFYRSRSHFHGATTEAACVELEGVLESVKSVFPKAYQLQKAHEAWERSKELHTEMLSEAGSPMASRGDLSSPGKKNLLGGSHSRSSGALSEGDQEGDLIEHGFEEGLKGRIKRAMKHHLVKSAAARFREAGMAMKERSKNTWETAQTRMHLKWDEYEHKYEAGSKRGKFMTYLKKFKGTDAGPLKGTNPTYCLWTFVGSFLALLCVTGMDYEVGKKDIGANNLYALVTSFGAVSLILFSTPNSPFGQPRNVIGGHLISATTGVVMQYLKPTFITQFVMSALAPSVTIFLMSYTGLMHPPAAACCTIYVSGGPRMQHLGWVYIFFPVLADTMIMFILALGINNMSNQRQYPLYW